MKSLRQKELVKLLKKNIVINTIEMSEKFGVSIETIRRDLDQLESQGLIKKIYGGAELIYQNDDIKALPIEKRMNEYHDIKAKLAERAGSLINNGSSVALDAGSTILELSKRITEKTDMTILCGDIFCAEALLKGSGNKIFMMGGYLTENGTSSGAYVKEFLNSIAYLDYFICATDGANPEEGLSTDEPGINTLKQYYIKKANTKIAIIDHSKFNKRGFYKLCSFSEFDIVVTDSETPLDTIERIRRQGVKVEVVEV